MNQMPVGNVSSDGAVMSYNFLSSTLFLGQLPVAITYEFYHKVLELWPDFIV